MIIIIFKLCSILSKLELIQHLVEFHSEIPYLYNNYLRQIIEVALIQFTSYKFGPT